MQSIIQMALPSFVLVQSVSIFVLPLSLSLFLSFPSRYSCLSSMWHRLHRGGDAPGTRGFISWYSNALKHHTRLTRRRQCAARRCYCHGFHVDKRHCELAALAIETTCDCSLSLRYMGKCRFPGRRDDYEIIMTFWESVIRKTTFFCPSVYAYISELKKRQRWMFNYIIEVSVSYRILIISIISNFCYELKQEIIIMR